MKTKEEFITCLGITMFSGMFLAMFPDYSTPFSYVFAVGFFVVGAGFGAAICALWYVLKDLYKHLD